MIDPILLAAGRLAAAADGVIRCPSVMELSDRLHALDTQLNEYYLLIFSAPQLNTRPPDDVLEEYLSRQGPTPNQFDALKKLLNAGAPFDYLYPLQRAPHGAEYYLFKCDGGLYLYQGTTKRRELLVGFTATEVPDGQYYIPYQRL